MAMHFWKATVLRSLGITVMALPMGLTFIEIVGHASSVRGSSMQPTLNPPKAKRRDVVLQNRWAVRHYKFQRGEVVSFINPRNPRENFIKRIIGLEGDIVKTLHYKNRYLKIPQGHCWLEGDNHGRSMDSNTLGPVPVGLIYAKNTHVIWPPQRWQRLPLRVPENRINHKKPKPQDDVTNNSSDDDSFFDEIHAEMGISAKDPEAQSMLNPSQQSIEYNDR